MKDWEIHGESNVWSTAQRWKRSTYMMFMLGLRETIEISWLWQTVFVGMVMF